MEDLEEFKLHLQSEIHAQEKKIRYWSKAGSIAKKLAGVVLSVSSNVFFKKNYKYTKSEFTYDFPRRNIN